MKLNLILLLICSIFTSIKSGTLKAQKNESTEIITGNNENELIKNFIGVLKQKHFGNDSVKLIFSYSRDKWFLFEVYMPKDSLNKLYFLDDYNYDENFNGHWYKIADLKKSNKEINTPGEFLFFMMKIREENDIDALKTVIPDSGFHTNKTIHIGNVYDPQYEHNKAILRDSINFKNIYFNFTTYLFSSYVSIPKKFNKDGKAKIQTGGGGFLEYIWIEKTEKGVFLTNHYSIDH